MPIKTSLCSSGNSFNFYVISLYLLFNKQKNNTRGAISGLKPCENEVKSKPEDDLRKMMKDCGEGDVTMDKLWCNLNNQLLEWLFSSKDIPVELSQSNQR